MHTTQPCSVASVQQFHLLSRLSHADSCIFHYRSHIFSHCYHAMVSSLITAAMQCPQTLQCLLPQSMAMAILHLSLNALVKIVLHNMHHMNIFLANILPVHECNWLFCTVYYLQNICVYGSNASILPKSNSLTQTALYQLKLPALSLYILY